MRAGAAYLTYVSLLNQAVMMSTQLYNDATTPAHHKYAAHQVALLYVSDPTRASSNRQPGPCGDDTAGSQADVERAPAAAMLVLYAQQSLNMLQGETKPIRRLIEGRFDEIKAITESQHPWLDLELSSWCVVLAHTEACLLLE